MLLIISHWLTEVIIEKFTDQLCCWVQPEEKTETAFATAVTPIDGS